MIIRTALENNEEGFRSIAWALEYPGCFAYGKDSGEALANFPTAIQEYAAWTAAHGCSWIDVKAVAPRVEEQFDDFTVDRDYERVEQGEDEVNAWFLYDWKPLTAENIRRGLDLLAWSRADLLETIKDLSPAQLEREHTGERWNINGIIKHIGGAEWWYLDRLDRAFPRDQVPNDPLARLEKVRQHFTEVLSTLENSTQVAGKTGEFWSPRKMLRRAVWHERDHTLHIRKLL